MKTITCKPWQRDGSTGFFREDGTRQCTGSMMGRRTILPEDRTEPVRLRLERLRLNSGGCYDQGGAYWGAPETVWCGYGDGSEVAVEVFLRADDRAEAKDKIRAMLPNATFFR